MVLCSLEAHGFRNLQPSRVEFDPGLNLLWGENGAGKSNLLEAIYYLFTTCSFRTQRTTELIEKGKEGFSLFGVVKSAAGTNRLGLEQRGRVRTLMLDDRPVGLEEVVTRFSVLAFSSRQMEVVRGGPRERRRFLDRGILALRPGYFQQLREFRRTLAQRNELLARGARPAEKAAWDERFAAAAVAVREARREYTTLLASSVETHAGELLAPGGGLSLDYRPSPGLPSDRDGAPAQERAAELMEALSRREADERRMGHAVMGPHRDEVRILAGGEDLARFGSAGQQRTSLLALELTRLELCREARGEAPILLVDDLDADLDERAAGCLLERAGRAQALLSTCRARDVRRYAPPAKPYRVSSGAVEPAVPGKERVRTTLAGEQWNRA